MDQQALARTEQGLSNGSKAHRVSSRTGEALERTSYTSARTIADQRRLAWTSKKTLIERGGRGEARTSKDWHRLARINKDQQWTSSGVTMSNDGQARTASRGLAKGQQRTSKDQQFICKYQQRRLTLNALYGLVRTSKGPARTSNVLAGIAIDSQGVEFIGTHQQGLARLAKASHRLGLIRTSNALIRICVYAHRISELAYSLYPVCMGFSRGSYLKALQVITDPCKTLLKSLKDNRFHTQDQSDIL